AKKLLMIVCDGLSDRPSRKHDMKTPLQSARKPAMDSVARHGISGNMDVIDHGVIPGSDTAHLALFGYDPYSVYTGRGPIEAAGAGIDLVQGDVAFRCNFASVDKNLVVRDRRAGRIKSGTAELAKAVSGMELDGVKVIVREGSEHRAVLVLRGNGLDHRVTDVDPHQEARILESKPLAPEAARTAQILNEFVNKSSEILASHPVNLERIKAGLPPANIILPRGAGSIGILEPFEKRYGLKAGAVAGVTLVKGICRMVGMEAPNIPGATGGVDTDYRAKAEATLKMLDRKEFVFVNVKAGDVAGHDGDFSLKVHVVENIDMMLGMILKDIGEEVILALTCDHSTPVSVREHSADPVPVSIAGSGVRVDGVKEFDEISCASGALHRIKGVNLMPIMLGIADRAKKFGA
ncbi:MAG TPA: 2,3-bisphosphoglycerate-independent phosphoglycerate mutase, partial [Thermoplasmata archaeon]|nr:2,3-bisphosphoglycerate-independent phosphoglycerate mutase [Thermoplasmata archaeon]